MYAALAIAAVSIASAVLMPKPNANRQQAQSPNPPEIPTSSLGSPLPIVFGTGKVAGNYMYLVPARKVEEQAPSGKGAPPQQPAEEYFVCDLIGYSLCREEPVQLEELYLNGDVVYQRVADNPGQQNRFNDFLAEKVIFFDGGTTQNPSADIEFYEGAGNVPHYRGMSYILIKDLNLSEFGNSYPTLTAVLSSKADYSNAKLWIDRIIELSGVNADSQQSFIVDVLTTSDSLSDIPFEGAVFENAGGDYGSFISPFLDLYQIYLREIADGQYQLDLPFRFDQTDLPISLIDVQQVLGVDNKKAYTLSDKSKNELPNTVNLSYKDPNRQFDPNSYTAINSKRFTDNETSVSVNYAMTRNQAVTAAERLLRAAWFRKKTIVFTLPIEYDSDIRIGSFVQFSNDPVLLGLNWIVVETAISDNFFLEVSAVQLNPVIQFYNKGTVNTIPRPPVVSDSVAAQDFLVAAIFDTPLVGDDDTPRSGVYLHLNTQDFSALIYVYRSDDGGATYNLVDTIANTNVGGNLEEPLPVQDPFTSQEGLPIVVSLTNPNDSILSVTQQQYEEGEFLIGIDKEIISVRDAVSIGDGLFELRGYTRGFRGSDQNIQAYPEGQTFVVLKTPQSDNRLRTEIPANLANQTVFFRFVTDTSLDLDSITAIGVNYEAEALKTFANVDNAPILETNGDWTLTWTPRSILNIGDSLADGSALPSNPDGNNHEVLIYDASQTLLRTETTTTNSFTYTVAQQIADTGSQLGFVDFDTYAISNTSNVGRSDLSRDLD